MPSNASTTCSRSAIDRFSRTVPLVFLSCGLHATISGVVFASFGRPGGNCAIDGLTHRKPGVCHAASSEPVLRSLCVGLRSCTVHATASVFGGDPCPGKPKRLIAQVTCTHNDTHTRASSGAGAKQSETNGVRHSQAVTPSARSRASEVPAAANDRRDEQGGAREQIEPPRHAG